jgi:hypothetical protein
MGEAVDASIRHLKPSDTSAIVSNPAPSLPAEGMAANVDSHGKAVYEGACAGRHGWTEISPVPAVDVRCFRFSTDRGTYRVKASTPAAHTLLLDLRNADVHPPMLARSGT